ncbi:unnamed protein product [Brassica oleracea]
MDLEVVRCPNEATLEKLISGSFVQEDLKILRYSVKGSKGFKSALSDAKETSPIYVLQRSD